MAHVYHQRQYRSPAVWQDSMEGMVPHHNPVVGGHDVDGTPIYVGRAIHDQDTIPGKVVPSHRVCYVAHGMAEHAHHSYQVLTNPHHAELAWVPAHGGQVPTGALQGGQQSDGQALFIGRGYHDGSMVVGKVHPDHHTCYISFGGNEVALSSYEVLVVRNLHAHDF